MIAEVEKIRMKMMKILIITSIIIIIIITCIYDILTWKFLLTTALCFLQFKRIHDNY